MIKRYVAVKKISKAAQVVVERICARVVLKAVYRVFRAGVAKKLKR